VTTRDSLFLFLSRCHCSTIFNSIQFNFIVRLRVH